MSERWNFNQVADGHERIRLESSNREQFQEAWTKLLTEAGWTREEFHTALDNYYYEKYFRRQP